MKLKSCIIAIALSAMLVPMQRASACTNVIVTPGASADGSGMVSYAIDNHTVYGELYYHKAASWKPGSMLQIYDWDTSRHLGEIPQVPYTYQTLGNMNQYQLIIGETTFEGRLELMNKDGIVDYGSLIYIALQRAKTAREAIAVIADLANTYGYPSEGESFSLVDKTEAWIMELIGKGEEKGIVWVARRIPDGYICAHANCSRITTFPQDDPENCIYSPDVIEFARKKGYFSGEDKDFSFRDAYDPPSLTGARCCDARVWNAFRILCDDEFRFVDENGNEVTKPANDWLEYALGNKPSESMPLFVKPSRKLTVKNVADVMRDHYEGTPMDMTLDIGAGGNALPYRWRPQIWKYDGKYYMTERAIATQQTAAWFVAQCRPNLPDEIGGLFWFGCDDAATSWVTPIYVNSSDVPDCFRVGNGDRLHYSPTSAFWICNRVAQACYKMYNYMAPVARKAIDEFENDQIFNKIPQMDEKLLSIYNGKRNHPGKKRAVKKAISEMTKYSIETAQTQFNDWVKMEEFLLVKFIDGNIMASDENNTFIHKDYSEAVPESYEQPGYTMKWKENVARDNWKMLRLPW